MLVGANNLHKSRPFIGIVTLKPISSQRDNLAAIESFFNVYAYPTRYNPKGLSRKKWPETKVLYYNI
jgi:hypothetical protein